MQLKYIYLGLSLLFKIAINILIVFFIAKKVNIQEFGVFSLAFVFATVAVSILDFGFNLKSLILAGEKREVINSKLSLMIYGKIVIAMLVFLFLGGFLYLNSVYNYETKIIILILVLSSIPTSFGNFYLNSFKVINKFQEESKGFFVQGILLVFLLVINEIFGKSNILYYAVIILITRVLYFLYSIIIFQKQFTFDKNFKQSSVLKMLEKALPYAIHIILGGLIIYIDTFILSIFSNLENVGVYQAGMRIIMATMILAIIVSDAFIPEISELVKKKQKTNIKLQNLFRYIMVFSMLVITTIFFYKDTIIKLLLTEKYLILGKYLVYILSIIFLRYFGIVPGIILTSYKKQNKRAKAIFVAVVVSVLLNIYLIPILGIEGAFISSLIAHFVLNLLYLYDSSKVVSFVKIDKGYLFIGILIIFNIYIQKTFMKDSIYYFIFTVFINIFILAIYSREKIYSFIKKHIE